MGVEGEVSRVDLEGEVSRVGLWFTAYHREIAWVHQGGQKRCVKMDEWGDSLVAIISSSVEQCV